MTAAVLAAPRSLALGRVAAVAALGSAAVHLVLLDGSSLSSVVMVLLAAACLPCAWHLWRSPTASVWRSTALVDAVMLVVHLQMLGGTGEHAMHAMHGTAHDMAADASTGGLMWIGLGLVGVQLALAGGAALRRPF